jgi:hypothetical protein
MWTVLERPRDLYRGFSYPLQMGPHLYWVVAPPGINVRLAVNWRRLRRCAPVRGYLYRAVARTSTNALIYTGGKNTRYK